MKKSLIALAVLGAFAGAASAQSSVTIYGVVDMGIQKTNGGTALNSGVVAGAAGDAWQLRQSTPSRLGFRGTEDLGGGLSAQFQFEHRFEPDTGIQTNANEFWAGRSYVQLTSNKLGSVYLGREYIPSFWVALKADPFGQVGVGNIATHQNAGYGAIGGGSAVRTANTVGYKSPKFGGLTAQVATALSETSGSGRQFGANVEYAQGPIWAGVGFDKRTRSSVANQDENQLINVGAAYDFGRVRPVVYYARSETGVNGNFSNNVYSIGLTAPVAGGLVKAVYARVNLSNAAGSAVVANNPPGSNDYKKLGLGYDYPLSKRTNLYADFGFAKQDNRSNNRAAAFGVKHTF